MNRHENPVLARKVRGPKMRLAGFPALEPLCTAFATICATHVRKALQASVDVEVFGYETIRHGAFLAKLEAPTTIFILKFPGDGGLGLVRAHPKLLDRVLDMSLDASISGLAEDGERELTPIDVSIYGSFVDLIARGFDEAVVELCGQNRLGLGKRAHFESVPGMVRIAPNRAEVLVIKLGFNIGEQDRFAGLDLAVPVASLDALKTDLVNTAPADDDVVELWETSMQERVMGLPLQTDCVIDLGAFSVGELSRLEQGALLELPAEAMNSVELRVPTVGGDVAFAHGRLGANGRHKAVRLVDDPSDEFLEPLRQITPGPTL